MTLKKPFRITMAPEASNVRRRRRVSCYNTYV